MAVLPRSPPLAAQTTLPRRRERPAPLGAVVGSEDTDPSTLRSTLSGRGRRRRFAVIRLRPASSQQQSTWVSDACEEASNRVGTLTTCI